MVTFAYFFVLTLFMILCAILCFVVLIQESKSTGLGASFGGDAGDSVFGTSTADVLKKFTGWLAVIFLSACLILSMWTSALARNKTHSASFPYTIEQQQ